MTHHQHDQIADGLSFSGLLNEVMAQAPRFGHRQHIHLTWLALRHHSTGEAIAVVSDGIQRTARYVGFPQKYHVTMSRAWVECVAHHADHCDARDFDEFARRNPALLDKKLLSRFYRSTTLASDRARRGWVTPDAAQFPWQKPHTTQDRVT